MPPEVSDQLVDWVQSRHFGKHRGMVVDVEDPTHRGRLKVRVPAVLGDLAVWAMPCVPYAGDGIGLYAIPETGSGVWVEFEEGDLSFPIWTGAFWGDDQLPESEEGAQATPPLKIIRSEKGLMVTMDDGSQTISVSDEDGSNILTIEVTAGKITVKGATKAVVEAPQIELVENATHPVVFGDRLMQYLTQLAQLYTSHLHPGELALGVFPVAPAPPVPPIAPPTPEILSKKVKSG